MIAGLQSVVSRRADLTKSPAVVSVGMIHGGSSQNVIPDTIKMVGTIRSYDPGARKKLHADIKQAAEHIRKEPMRKRRLIFCLCVM
ncbi:peptidase dimerization domain-containing protein [Dyadobacter sp.]|uniref:peptidase dimerization domain-containing protein n=1 Tax=Dyadobacter sp. TaxID=1914288 RepID=UPI003F6F0580